MYELQHTGTAGVKFLRTELSAARAFLDIAETSSGNDTLERSLRNAEMALSAIHQVLACGGIDPLQAEEIRAAARTISGLLTRLATR
ncbi:MAG: hypothetical protein EHM59_17440 [Betaproteobacteria bacterium]|nr:MAG: hypothetical protein EHM59_17440 [Betaproteobacteria bacterium]